MEYTDFYLRDAHQIPEALAPDEQGMFSLRWKPLCSLYESHEELSEEYGTRIDSYV